jgi:hypothetical protein
VAAKASPNRLQAVEKLGAERARIRRQVRRWQQACDADDPNEPAGLELSPEQRQGLEQRLRGIPGGLQELRKSGMKRCSVTDPDSRLLHQHRGFVRGYTATIASSEDPLIVEQRVGRNPTDYESLVPMVKAVGERCGARRRWSR